MNSEKGYALLEVLLLSAFALAMAASIALLEKTALTQEADGERAQVVYLVQAEFAYLEQRATKENLQANTTYPWLGEADKLQLQHGTCQIQAEVGSVQNEIYPVSVKAIWQNGRRTGEMTMERLIVAHGGELSEK